MVRSENYDIMVPSHTLKHKAELSAKEASYYELKQLTKLINSSRKLAGSLLTQTGLPTDYGSEELSGQLRQVFVRDLNILSLFNGQLSVSKAGPKSAEDPNFTKEKALG